MDFCPHDFERFDLDNLAYEMVFADGWDFERLCEEAFGAAGDELQSEQSRNYIEMEENKRSIHYAVPGVDAVQHIILSEKRDDGMEMSGFQWIKSIFAQAKEESHSGNPEKKLVLTHRKDEDTEIDEFIDQNHNVIFSAWPCCPYCHNRLPMHWETAEDFAPVALMGPTGGGKTSFLYSALFDEWRSVDYLGKFKQDIQIYSAHAQEDETDTMYYSIVRAAREMCRDYGKCPQNTDKEHWIPPVFVVAECGEHRTIIGIYDNAGETLAKMNALKKRMVTMLQKRMFADIFLFTPESLNIHGKSAGEKGAAPAVRSLEGEVLTLEEQGRNQGAGKSVSAAQLLFQLPQGSNQSQEPAEEVDTTFQVYKALKNSRNAARQKVRMRKQMYFAGALIKSDLMEHMEGVADNDLYRCLFERARPAETISLETLGLRSSLVSQMIQELDLIDEQDISDITETYGGDSRDSVSWHCISALGCDAEMAGHLKGRYQPIRVAEPLVMVILKRFRDNGWLEEG